MTGTPDSLSQYVLIGGSAIGDIENLISRVADSSCPVLVEGESGTGKELVARQLHLRSYRRACPFIPVNCAGVGEGVFESQFFGHVRGAFTGAEQTMLGLVRAADEGTLFLDEVGDIPITMQAKLLRVLQDGEILPVGTTEPQKVRTRFVAATNRNLHEDVKAGKFRKDLYYRLNIVRIHIPPLRDRRGDIELLLDYFHKRFCERYYCTRIPVRSPVVGRLKEHSWPGNVRELAGWVERLYATKLSPESLAEELGEEAARSTVAAEPFPPRVMALKEAERWAICRALEHTERNLTEAARLLQIHRTTLWRKLRQYDDSPGST